MWRCVCGHAFYSALPANCPSCERVVDADVEETVTVDGRRLPFRVWEAEVLVCAAGWIVAQRGLVLVVAGTLLFLVLTGRDAFSLVFGALWIMTGLALIASGRGAFRRARSSRVILLVQSAVCVPMMLCMIQPLGEGRSLGGLPVLVAVVAGQLALDAVILFAVLSSSGDWVWEWGGKSEPVASLSSAWRVGRSIRAWACVGAVALAALAGVLLVWSIVPWAGLFP